MEEGWSEFSGGSDEAVFDVSHEVAIVLKGIDVDWWIRSQNFDGVPPGCVAEAVAERSEVFGVLKLLRVELARFYAGEGIACRMNLHS